MFTKESVADVTVIIPYYNASSTIERCLLSVYKQTQPVAEVIVIDDCSDIPLMELECINQFYAFSSFKIIRLDSNAGASVARNVGIDNAKFKYAAFLDSDDIWFSNKIKIQFYLMEKNKMLMSAHQYDFEFHRDLSRNITLSEIDCQKISKTDFIFGNPFFTPTVMVKIDGFVGFDKRFRRVDDYKAWFETFDLGAVYLIKEELAAGFKHPIGFGGLSGSLPLMHQSYISVLDTLYHEGVMTKWIYISAKLIEYIKYPLRLLKVQLRKHIKT